MLDSELEYTDLHEVGALTLAVLAERIAAEEARLAASRANLDLHKLKLQLFLAEVNNEYQEDGKYKVVNIDAEKRKVGRIRIEQCE